MSDHKGAALMINALPGGKAMLGDRGYDADWFRPALADSLSRETADHTPKPHCGSRSGRADESIPNHQDHG